jgi:hypothetical protein
MKKIAILAIFIFISNIIYCQLLKPDPLGLDYFNKGSKLIEAGDYIGADSLLTVALCSYKNENVYFNRALSRLLQKDTLGYCQDLDIAANKYFDPQAENYYNQICCKKVDTIYYDKSRVKSTKSNYRYYEVIKYPLYDTMVNGTFNDIKSSNPRINVDFGCDQSIIGLYSSTTNLIASYQIEDSVRYYSISTTAISIFNTTAYGELKKRAKIFLSSKYQNIKSENKIENLKVFFLVYFNKIGDVVKVKYAGFYPEVILNVNKTELEKDLLSIASNYPKVKPAKFFKENVCYIAYDYVEF